MHASTDLAYKPDPLALMPENEVARLFSVSRAKLKLMITRGEIPEPIEAGDRRWWTELDLFEWVQSKRAQRGKGRGHER